MVPPHVEYRLNKFKSLQQAQRNNYQCSDKFIEHLGVVYNVLEHKYKELFPCIFYKLL